MTVTHVTEALIKRLTEISDSIKAEESLSLRRLIAILTEKEKMELLGLDQESASKTRSRILNLQKELEDL